MDERGLEGLRGELLCSLRRRLAPQHRGERRYDRRRGLQVALELPFQVARPEVLAQGRGERARRGGSAARRVGREEEVQVLSLLLEKAGELVDQTGLPDPRLALDEQDLPLAVPGAVVR